MPYLYAPITVACLIKVVRILIRLIAARQRPDLMRPLIVELVEEVCATITYAAATLGLTH